MEIYVTLFMALVLLGNASVLLFLAWLLRSLERETSRYRPPSATAIKAVATRLEQAESASAIAASWSGRIRRSIVEANSDFDRVEDWFHYGLAKIDFNVEKASQQLDATAKRISVSVSEPLYRTATVIQGVKAVLELLTLPQRRDGDAGPRSAA